LSLLCAVGLSIGAPVSRRIQEDLRQLLPLRRCISVRRARLPDVWCERRWDNRLPRVHLCTERDVTRPAGAKTQVGVQHVRLGWQRLHLAPGDARDCHSKMLCHCVWLALSCMMYPVLIWFFCLSLNSRVKRLNDMYVKPIAVPWSTIAPTAILYHTHNVTCHPTLANAPQS